jgi:hypothetical protein
MSSNNANTSIVYRSKLFQNSQQQASALQASAQANKQQQSKPVYKSFCKVCQDAGKTDKEYTSHNVRDKSGKTTCPTLLALECRNCYKKGHTVKYCKLLTVQAVQERANPVKQEIKKSVPKNVFMVLESDSDSEEEEQQQFVLAPALNQKPVLSYRRIIDQANNPEAHAQAQAKAKAERDAVLEAERDARNKRILKLAPTKSKWADAESSDEEDDEEDEDTNTKTQTKEQVVDNSAW